jgi:hypothetical protein
LVTDNVPDGPYILIGTEDLRDYMISVRDPPTIEWRPVLSATDVPEVADSAERTPLPEDKDESTDASAAAKRIAKLEAALARSAQAEKEAKENLAKTKEKQERIEEELAEAQEKNRALKEELERTKQMKSSEQGRRVEVAEARTSSWQEQLGTSRVEPVDVSNTSEHIGKDDTSFSEEEKKFGGEHQQARQQLPLEPEPETCPRIWLLNQEPKQDSQQHSIATSEIVVQDPRCMPEGKANFVQQELDRLLTLGIIRPSSSPWISPTRKIPKRNEKSLIYQDCAKSNEPAIRDNYLAPEFNEYYYQVPGFHCSRLPALGVEIYNPMIKDSPTAKGR